MNDVGARPPQRPVLVLGGGGALGSQVVAQLLTDAAFPAVGVLVDRPVQPALRGLHMVLDDDAAVRALAPGTAVIVFDRARHANGRDEAFVRPEPAELFRWAARLHAYAAQALIVVVPHAPGLLPQALRVGLASLDEGRVAALGFRHLVFMRSAQTGSNVNGHRPLPQRLAHWMLSQLRWMVPQHEQPVRSQTVARVASRLAARLPAHAEGTRVLPAEALWAAAQRPGDHSVVDAWLAGLPLPAAPQRRVWAHRR